MSSPPWPTFQVICAGTSESDVDACRPGHAEHPGHRGTFRSGPVQWPSGTDPGSHPGSQPSRGAPPAPARWQGAAGPGQPALSSGQHPQLAGASPARRRGYSPASGARDATPQPSVAGTPGPWRGGPPAGPAARRLAPAAPRGAAPEPDPGRAGCGGRTGGLVHLDEGGHEDLGRPGLVSRRSGLPPAPGQGGHGLVRTAPALGAGSGTAAPLD